MSAATSTNGAARLGPAGLTPPDIAVTRGAAEAVAAPTAIRVALVTDADVFAGTERHILELATALRRAGAVVAVACPGGSPLARRAAARGLRVLPAAKQWPLDRRAVRVLRDMLASGEIDVVHAHNGRSMMTSVLAVLLAGRGCSIATQHFLEPTRTLRKGLKGLVSRAVHGFMSRRTHGFVAVSKASRDAIIARGDAPADRLSMVPNGIDDPLPPAGSIREELGVPAASPLVVCAARLEPEKDVESLVRAFRIVVDSHPSALCLIAGEGTREASLRRLIVELGLGQACRLLGFREDVPRIMRAADVFALPSPAEPFGLVLLEAMALCKPIVAVNAGGPAEIVSHDQTGILVGPSDPRSFAAALVRLLDDPPLRLEMGRAGRARWLERYTADRMAVQTLACYDRALKMRT